VLSRDCHPCDMSLFTVCLLDLFDKITDPLINRNLIGRSDRIAVIRAHRLAQIFDVHFLPAPLLHLIFYALSNTFLNYKTVVLYLPFYLVFT
jgi:hypothetical protein